MLAHKRQSPLSTLDLRSMGSRVASLAIGIPLLVFFVWIGSPWFGVLVAAIAAVGCLELCNMARKWGDRPITPVAIVWAVAFVVAAHFLDGGSPSATIAVPVLGIGAAVALTSILWCHGAGTRLSGWGVTAAAALYTGGLLSFGPLLRELDQGVEWVLFFLVVIFATDICAFLMGQAAGRRPLAKSISPSKTWEGAIGGVMGAAVASVVAASGLGLDISPIQAVGLGALISVVGETGDLVESQLKRLAGVKNSGWMVPGHGGVLDRIDSIVFNLVVVYHFAS